MIIYAVSNSWIRRDFWMEPLEVDIIIAMSRMSMSQTHGNSKARIRGMVSFLPGPIMDFLYMLVKIQW